AESDGGRRLALAGRSRTDRRDQDQLAVGPLLEPGEKVLRQLRLGPPIGQDGIGRNVEPGPHLHDRREPRRTGDLDVALGHLASLLRQFAAGSRGSGVSQTIPRSGRGSSSTPPGLLPSMWPYRPL